MFLVSVEFIFFGKSECRFVIYFKFVIYLLLFFIWLVFFFVGGLIKFDMEFNLRLVKFF